MAPFASGTVELVVSNLDISDSGYQGTLCRFQIP
jgi:hypothetical protein